MSVRASVLITVVGFVAAACLDIQRGVVGVQAPATPEFAHVQDLDGMPDLIVDNPAAREPINTPKADATSGPRADGRLFQRMAASPSDAANSR